MRCLALRHIACEDLGTFSALLKDRFGNVDYIDMPGRNAAPPELEAARDAGLVVVLGGPQGVYEAGEYPFLKRELEILAERIAHQRPTLGICLGAQLLAAAAGARVYASGRQEIGWYPVRLTEAALASPAANALTNGQHEAMFFHWHGDTFDLPQGATPLGSSDAFAHQGFMIGHHTVALQFHAEVNASILEKWLDEYEATLPVQPGVMTARQLRDHARIHGADLEARSADFLKQFLKQNFG